MTRFETGKEYKTRSVCDYDIIFTAKIISRTGKSVLVSFDHEMPVRKKIKVFDDQETISMGNYSMAPIFRA